MDKFSLEIENWGEWQLEKDFSSFEGARQYGLERFPQNEWRIFDRNAREFVHRHDPSCIMQETAKQELDRFADTAKWRQRFAERAAAEVVANQQRERMAEIAARQRSRQRELNSQRRRRIRGFNFVGSRPDILDIFDEWSEAGETILRGTTSSRQNIDEKVNWLKEGF